jgi:hypothetical protein
VRSNSRKTISVRRLESTLRDPPDIHAINLGAHFDKDLRYLRKTIVNLSKFGRVFNLQAPIAKIKEMLSVKRAVRQWITYTRRQRIQKRCMAVAKEMMERIWHPERLQKMGWDLEEM